ncbi:MAG: site-specific integrase [Proteobacteria bacterium]|nr:site-specific integrase [Pseudomonadota bacterium]
MAVFQECPACHKKQANRNRRCSCGEDLLKAKKSKRVRYWVSYRLPSGKQRKEAVGFSIEEARDAEGKRRSQKREGRIFDMLPQKNMTFSELAVWYLDLPTVKALRTYIRIGQHIKNLNRAFGDCLLRNIQPVDLEAYQTERAEQGAAKATVDHELETAKAVINKGFDNNLVDGQTVRAFKLVRCLLRPGENARNRLLGFDEYLNLLDASKGYLRAVLVFALNTGMRQGEILNLTWSRVDRETGFIRLLAEATKENKPKAIPINHHARRILDGLPRALHIDNVFTKRGRRVSGDTAANDFAKACKAAGIAYGMKTPGGLKFHDIRTTVKTNLLRAGVDKALRDTLLGHSLRGMDTYYLKPTEADLEAAMDRYTSWLDGQLGELGQHLGNISENVTP